MCKEKDFRELFTEGKTYIFKVAAVHSDHCTLVDENSGVISFLQQTSKFNLKKNQKVKCRVKGFNDKHPILEMVDAFPDFNQPDNDIDDEALNALLVAVNFNWNNRDFVKMLMLDHIGPEYDTLCHRWIQQLINRKSDLRQVLDDCGRLLENSDLLNLCSMADRELYQQKLSRLMERLEFYIAASDLVNGNNSEALITEYVDTFYNKLRASGYVYKPRYQFSVLSCLFLLRPDVMNARFRELLDLIFLRNLSIWQKPPFNECILKLLEIYITMNEDKVDKVKDNSELIENILFALHVQFFIASADRNLNVIDMRLVYTRLCLFSTYVQGTQREKLMNAAFFNLFNSNSKTYNFDKSDFKLTPFKLAQYDYTDIDTAMAYVNRDVKVMVSKDGIALYSDSKAKNLTPTFPKDLGLWKNMQIYRENNEVRITPSKCNDLTLFQKLWEEIEQEFLTLKQPVVAPHTASRHRRPIDKPVRISFLRQDDENRDKFYCQIEDEFGGEGYIYVSDIVTYSTPANLRDFYDNDGGRYVYDARILEENNGVYHFSMLEEIKDIVNDGYYGDDEEIVCSLGGAPNPYNRYAPAITREGVGISVKVDYEFDGVGRFDVIKCRRVGVGSGTYNIECRMVGFVDEPFDVRGAFRTLLSTIADATITEEAKTADTSFGEMVEHALLNERYVKEIVFLVDRMAFVDSDYMKSYNYLGFARMLSLLLGDDIQAAYYKGRMDIIANLHYFGKNASIDEEILRHLAETNAELLTNNPVLKDRFLQLQAISYKDKPQCNGELFRLMEAHPELHDLASLVIAYNVTKQNGLDSSANDIYNKLINMLHIKGRETGLKYYGQESEVVEFKTSVIFHAGQSMDIPNFDRQIKEILKVVAAFMNTNGGTLYVGVNDAGYGVGLEKDLRSAPYYGDKDRYMRSVQDAIAQMWDNSVLTTYIDVAFDADNADKDVLKVEVRPHPAGVAIDSLYWVKAGSTKRSLSRIEYMGYKSNRRN